MEIHIRDGLPFVSAVVHYQGNSITITDVLVDTGSAGSVFSTDLVLEIGIRPAPTDFLRRVTGVGGSEYVFSKTITKLEVGSLFLDDFQIEVGAMNYGFDFNGIIGMDFLTGTKAIVDLQNNELRISRV